MKQETTLQKQKKGKPITDSRLAIWLRDRLTPCKENAFLFRER